MSVLDFIFPKKCVSCGQVGSYLCADCPKKIEFVDAPVCPVCQRQAVEGRVHPGCKSRYSLDGLVVACRYSGPVKAAIAKVKYRWIYDVEKVLVELLAKSLWRYDLPKNLILVPVPLHARRKRWRGFNQAEILTKSLAQKFKVPSADFMNRFIETKTQVGLSREDRKKNVKGAFALHSSVSLSPSTVTLSKAKSLGVNSSEGSRINGLNIILVDDVYTSGATMAECAKVLKQAGAKSVWGMAVALG